MRNLIKELKVLLDKNKNFTLFIWILVSAPLIKKFLIIYLFINILASLKFLKIYFLGKKSILKTSKLIDCTIIKWLLVINSCNSFHQKLDNFFLILLGYLIILIFPVSLKSLILSIKIFNQIKFNYLIKNNLFFFDIIETTIVNDLYIKTNLEELTFRKKKFKILSHSNRDDL